jgi:hypothetical protein
MGEPPSFAPANVKRTPTEIPQLTGAQGLSLGIRHGCALYADGHVICWGDASFGELGSGASPDAYQLQSVAGLPPLVEIASAGVYSCGRTAEGNVWCWGGHNEHGQLGSREPGNAPRQVPGVTGAVGLALTDRRACARLASSEVVCWGDSGGCGDATSSLPPARIEEFSASLQIVRASAGCFWCILRPTHELVCDAAEPAEGQLALGEVSMVVAGDDHACAVRLDGSVWCWGSNARGELGRETATGRDAEPAPVQWSAGMGN